MNTSPEYVAQPTEQENQLRSNIYCGLVSHRRFAPKKHSFQYKLYMLALDIDETLAKTNQRGIFGFSWFNPLRFVAKDYVQGEPNNLRQRIIEKVTNLGGDADIQRVTMLVQVRCFGLYFSPANFYFCYNKAEQCQQMLAEVSNTPWNKRHYYLVDLTGEQINEKAFHVSPFMDLNMAYHWRIKPPMPKRSKLFIHIENRRDVHSETSGDQENKTTEKLFDATLQLQKISLNRKNLLGVWLSLPIMTLKIVAAIYWQAMKLFIKRIPFVSYQKTKTNNSNSSGD